MKLSQLFTKTLKEHPADEVSKNAQLLTRAGYVYKEMAGVYTYLPLGLMALNNICNIIRQEMNAIGGQEMQLTTLQDPEIWKITDRWEDEKVDVWFKTELKNGNQLGLGPTHEEPLVRIARQYVQSYKDLPFMAYQIQTKFRNELRAKSGVMRGREFLMKDLYSFARNEAEHDELYERVKQAYVRVYDRLGIGDRTYLTFASGGMFSEYSHEFQTITDAGEDTVYVNRQKRIAVNEEVYNDEVLASLGLAKDELETCQAAEVGNIFTLKDKYSKPLELVFADDKGQKQTVMMGCYGIGPSRLLGVITECLADDKGLVWPETVAPFKVQLVQIGVEPEVTSFCESLYQDLQKKGTTVLYDDRDERAGQKFADADLLGMPHRVVVSKKTLQSDRLEYKSRTANEAELLTQAELNNRLGL